MATPDDPARVAYQPIFMGELLGLVPDPLLMGPPVGQGRHHEVLRLLIEHKVALGAALALAEAMEKQFHRLSPNAEKHINGVRDGLREEIEKIDRAIELWMGFNSTIIRRATNSGS